MTKPNIYEYLDIVLYLKDFYKYRKIRETGFSYEVWAKEIGFKSRSYLRSIIIGEKEFQIGMIQQFIESLSLDPKEVEYFVLLCQYGCKSNNVIRELAGKNLISIWKSKVLKLEIQNIAEFLKDPLIPVLFTYLSFDDSSSKFEDMQKVLGCDPTRLQNALKCLIWQKLVEGSLDECGEVSYKTVQSHFSVCGASNPTFIRNFHLDGLKLAELAATNFPSDQRKYYSSFVALDREQFLTAQSLIKDFNEKILALFNDKNIQGKSIYRINIQAFPVSTQI